MLKSVKVGDKFSYFYNNFKYKVVAASNGRACLIGYDNYDNLVDSSIIENHYLYNDKIWKAGWPIVMKHGGIYKLENGKVGMAIDAMCLPIPCFMIVEKSGIGYLCRVDKDGQSIISGIDNDYSIKQQLEGWPDNA